MSDIFDDALKITEESVAAQVEAGAIDTVYQENRALMAGIKKLREGHCDDCCCARSWEALGITEFTGRSIPEEIEQLRAENERLKAFIADKIHDATREQMMMEIQHE